VAEWLKAAVLKTASRKGRGFESYPFRQLRSRSQKTGVRIENQNSGVGRQNPESEVRRQKSEFRITGADQEVSET
jgi:hypothetical protein